MTSQFLPITKAEAAARGWDQLDFVYIIGDAYVDHPSFGAAIISRVIESLGFSIGIIPQPVSDRDYMEFGAPKYAFLVTGGNIDSMVAHYTAAKRKRSDDAYTPGGKAGRRPDRATIVYSRKLRQLYPDSPIVMGWRLRCGASPTTTTGTTRCAPPSLSTRRPICCCTAWAKR